MEELKRFEGSTFDTNCEEKNGRRSRYYPRTHKTQELQNEINCMRDFQDAEQSPIKLCLSHLIQFLGMPSRSIYRNAEQQRRAANHLGHRETFANPVSAPYHMSEPIHSSHAGEFRIRDASPDRQPKVQSSPVREILQRIMGQRNNDCRFRIFISTNSLHQPTLACWKIRFQTEVCTCSQFPTEAMQWIKEVELADSVDDLRSSSS